MNRKLISACMALAAFMALAVVPAVASASPEVTHPTGTTMATHTAGKTCTEVPAGCILGTNVGNLLMTDGSGNPLVTCTKATMTGELIKNTGTSIEGNITAATFSGTGGTLNGEPECTSENLGGIGVTPSTATNGLPWCLKSTGGDNFEVRGNSCTALARPIRFVLDTTIFGITCTYQRNTGIPGTFTTHPTDAIASISAVEFTSSSFGCPSQGFLDLSFTLETDTASTSPIYIS